MLQTKTIFVCKACDAQSLKWAGRCQECGKWGTLHEEIRNTKSEIRNTTAPGETFSLDAIKTTNTARLATHIDEVDRVLGGGIPNGAVILLAGEPGAGKSTLAAAIADKLAGTKHILYAAGEESPEQLKERFTRMGITNPRIQILTNTQAETIVATIAHNPPALLIVDSVQTLTAEAASGSGAPTQLRASTAQITESAKRTGIPVLLIGQVTKALDIAGPKSLEHLVDIVLSFEGERSTTYRVLRALKNRFGATDEIGIFAMTETGLTEVKNPSAAFLETRAHAPGSIVTCVLEGTRPLLIEIQALATRSHFPYPERRAIGFDNNRLKLLLAVLEKQGFRKANIANMDIHVNVTSGFRIREPAADLAVLLAIASSLAGAIIPQDLIAFGEVGLGGELRPVKDPKKRLTEAKKLGFTNALMPQTKEMENTPGTHPLTNLKDALSFLSFV